MAAGDCPHHDQLQNTLKNCQENKALIVVEHDNYLTIVDELKNDLDSLLSQVTMVQQEFCVNELAKAKEEQSFEASLKNLESQNDLLKQALVQNTEERINACSSLEQNNDNLKCQIEHLQHTVFEKEQRIVQLNTMLSRLSHMQLEPKRMHPNECCGGGTTTQAHDQELRELRAQLEQANRKVESAMSDLERSQKLERFLRTESRKLNDELIESKRKNCDLNTQMRRLATLLKTQEAHRMELSKKYEIMEQNYEDQAKKLRAANTQLNFLQERFTIMEKRHDEHCMERNLLREELLSLKEKEAGLLGKQKSIQEQLLKTEKELFTAHDVIKEQQCILQRNDFAHKDIVQRLQDASGDMKRQFNCIVEDYKRLEEEFEKQNEICKQNEKVIESFRKWKEAQLKADEATRASFKQYEEHIRLLLEDKQKFLEQYRDLHRDYSILQNELDRLKMCTFSTSAPGLNTSDNSIAHRMELIRRTSRRISEQSNSLRGEDTSQPMPLTSSKSVQDLR